jgi:very-short-patch-repair endonuclease
MHRSRLEPDEVTTIRAIPVTGLSRTLLDLAAVLPLDRVEQAVNQAEVQGLRDSLSLKDLLARHPGRAGVPKIREILERLEVGATLTHSELENRFLSFVRATGLPPPRVNANLHGFECDCIWPDHRLVVELDGHAVHGTTTAFERDRARDRALNADGWRTVRVTWRQLQLDAEALAADLSRILGVAVSR